MSTRIYNHEITYFIQGESTQRIKIGKTSTAVNERIRLLQTGSPDILIFLGVCFGPKRYESFLHRKFSEYRLHGEWFYPHPDIISYIEKNCITDEIAFRHAYEQIERGIMTFNEAIDIGTSELKMAAGKKYLEIVSNMYVNKDGV